MVPRTFQHQCALVGGSLPPAATSELPGGAVLGRGWMLTLCYLIARCAGGTRLALWQGKVMAEARTN